MVTVSNGAVVVALVVVGNAAIVEGDCIVWPEDYRPIEVLNRSFVLPLMKVRIAAIGEHLSGIWHELELLVVVLNRSAVFASACSPLHCARAVVRLER